MFTAHLRDPCETRIQKVGLHLGSKCIPQIAGGTTSGLAGETIGMKTVKQEAQCQDLRAFRLNMAVFTDENGGLQV